MRRFASLLVGLILLMPTLSFGATTVLPYGGMIPAAPIVVCPATGALPTTVGFSAATLSTNSQVVALSAGKRIAVYGFWINTLAATNLKWTEGTGSACATGNSVLTGIISNGGTNANFTSPAFMINAPLTTTTAGDALCINSGTSTTVSGFLVYCYQ